MSKRQKLLERLKQKPKDFTWEELNTVLTQLGYRESKAGKTGGSRRKFIHPEAPPILLHKPHPGNIIKTYIIDDVLEMLKRENML
jgi:hypothetical protein